MTADLIAALNESTQRVNVLLDEMLSGQRPEELYKGSRHLVEAGGKRLRPFITLESCKLVGGDPEKALPMAVAVELIHNFTLVHDDIMDMDHLRRGVPTVHVLYGVPLAINAGDMLFAKAYEAALRSCSRGVPLRKILSALEILTKTTIAICEGQTMDMAFEKRDDVGEEEYMVMIEKKTAALLVASAEAGAIVGGGSARQVRRLGRAMRASGLAFQIVDDVLGVTADEKVLGKPVGNDIREGKRTLILIHSLKHAGKRQRETLLKALGNRDATPEEIERAIETLKSTGSIDYALRKTGVLIRRAKRELEGFPPSETRDLLVALVDYIVARDR
jgi:geranylgeranyl diphosphate synthase type I